MLGNVTATVNAIKESALVIVDGEEPSVRLWVVQVLVLTAQGTVYVCLLRKSVIALTAGKDQVVMSPIVPVYPIAMPLERAMEGSIPQFVSTVQTIQWVLLVNFPVLMVMSTLPIASFVSAILASVDWLVTLSALDAVFATKAFVNVIKDGKAQHAKP